VALGYVKKKGKEVETVTHCNAKHGSVKVDQRRWREGQELGEPLES